MHTTLYFNIKFPHSTKCQPFVGKILKDDIWSAGTAEEAKEKGYPLLSTAIDQGLYHPNCKDTHTTYFEGISTPPEKPTAKEKQQAVDEYNQNQKAHYNAQQAKKCERISKYSLDDENKRIYKARVEQWRDKEKSLKPVANSGGSGIIKTRGDDMGLSIQIDKFTPCLVEKSTGEIINTKYSIIKKSELESISKKGWKFNWLADDLKKTTVYKLTLDDSTNSIQGLVAVTDYPRDKALYINIAESAPHNIGKNKQYEGVGGHLFAIAANESMKKGYGGFMFMDAKNLELVKYYHEKFGATLLGMPHPYRMFIDENNAQRLLNIYTMKGE